MGEQNPDASALEAADEKYVMRPWTHPAGEPVIIRALGGSHREFGEAPRARDTADPERIIPVLVGTGAVAIEG